METSEKKVKEFDEEELQESLEFCEDIYRYYETPKQNINYFDMNKHSILYNSTNAIRIEAEPIRKEERVVIVKNSVLSQILFFTISIIIAVFLSKLISGSIIQETMVSGHSMNPTLYNKERLLLNKFSYRMGSPKRFDVVVFSFNNGEHFVKRIIGLPGEKIQIRQGRVYVNNRVLIDDPIAEEINYAGIAENEVVIGPDQYFVLGDNRNHSYDSRYEDIGFINKKVILGKVWLRIYPLTKIGFVK